MTVEVRLAVHLLAEDDDAADRLLNAIFEAGVESGVLVRVREESRELV